MKITAALLLSSSATALAFSPSALNNVRVSGCRNPQESSALLLSAEPTEAQATSTATDETDSSSSSIVDVNASLFIPLTYSEMIAQASQCISDAYAQGMTRQIVRILLPRDPVSDQLGQMYETDAETSDRAKSQEMILVPTDESWQGGIMQLYRAASPTTKDILRQLSPTMKATGVPPAIIEDRNIDESGVDGVGLLYTQSGVSGGDREISSENTEGGFNFFAESVKLPTLSGNDMCVVVQPNQEIVDSIDKLSTETTTPLIALLNPQWRQVDDALDSASKSGGVVGAFASFLGGKGGVLKRLDDLQYTPSFTLEGYVCKGGNIRLIKRFDSDWNVFAENDSGDQFVKVGSMAERPCYQDVEKMLDDKGVGYKYARDLGMAPKL